jgi:hypothetical protein
MGNANATFVNGIPVTSLFAGAADRISENVDMVTVRFNYRFGGYGGGYGTPPGPGPLLISSISRRI